MPSKKTKSTRKQYIKQKVKEANDAINEGFAKKVVEIINEIRIR